MSAPEIATRGSDAVSSPITRDIYVARQPIYDAALNVIGYEVLYRGGCENLAVVIDGNQATSELFLNAVVEIGLERVVGTKLAFVNLTREFLIGRRPLPLASGQLVLEILEDITVDRELVDGVAALVSRGYVLALDDAVFRSELVPLLELATIVKVELPAIKKDDLASHVERFRHYPVKLLAEKVETLEEFNQCRELGFEYFQGFFLARPQMIPGKQRRSSETAILQVLGRLSNPAVTVQELEAIIKNDITLSYKLLRYINSARFPVGTKVESLRQAILLLGVEGVRTMAMLSSLAGTVQRPGDVLKDSMQRAVLCERLARLLNAPEPSASFTAGLVSSLDAVLNLPLSEILASLPLADDVRDAVLHRQGIVGETLRCAIALERADWDTVSCGRLTPEAVRDAYLSAIDEINALWDSFGR